MIDIFSQLNILEQFNHVWTAALLVFARCMAFASMSPPTSHKSIPAMVKISFAMLLTLMIMPNLDPPEHYPHGSEFIIQVIMNVFIGLIIGWMASLIIEIVKIAGELVNSQMALQSANLFDPGSQTQTTVLGKFFNLFAFVIFISAGGTEKVIEGLYLSFNTFPLIIQSINISFGQVLGATSTVITMGFLIVSPILMILLSMDLILGLMSRAAPQINAFQISFSIKPTVGLILILLILPALLPIVKGLCENPLRFLY